MKYRVKVIDMANDIYVVQKRFGFWIFYTWGYYGEGGCGGKEKMQKIVDELNKPV